MRLDWRFHTAAQQLDGLPTGRRFAHWAAWRNPNSQCGTVLLEVLVALALFVTAATIITAALSASLNSVDQLRFNTHAVNLAVSVLSELQMGIKTTALEGPQQFEMPFEGWTWEVVAMPLTMDSNETSPLKSVEVVIRHDDPALVYRLSQVLRIADANPPDEANPSSDSSSF